MEETTGIVVNKIQARYLKACMTPHQETEWGIVGSPADLLIESEPLELVGLSLEPDVPNRQSA